MDMDSDFDIVRSAALHAISFLKDERAVPIAIAVANDTTRTRYQRILALNILKDVGVNNPEVEKILTRLLADSDNRIRRKAIENLGYFNTESALQSLKQLQNENLPHHLKRKLKISIKKIEQKLNRNFKSSEKSKPN